MTLIQFDEDTKPTIQRDRWGRPLITPPNGGKPIAYTRVSTLAKGLDDNQGLINWKATATVVGALKRPGLIAGWQALLAQFPDPWYGTDESRRECKRLVEECAEAGGSSDRAALGTALHSLTELVDRGKTLEHVQPNLAADVEAYRATMDAAGVEVLADYMEAFVVVDELQVAGSFDLLVRLPDGRTVVADKKTGSSLDYSWLAFATQLACYSRGSLYDPATNTRTPLPNVDQASGLIIHIPAGTGTCTLHEVDLEAGWEAAQLSVEVRKWRSRKGLGRAWLSATSATPSETTSSSDGRRERAAKSTRSGSARSHSSAATTAASETPPTECTASTATTTTPSQSSAGEASPAATTSMSAGDDARRSALQRRIDRVKDNPEAARQLETRWKLYDTPKWADCQPDRYDDVDQLLADVEALHGLPFDPPPHTPEPLPPEPEQRPAEQLVNPDDVRVLFDKVQALEGDARAFWLQMAASLRAYGEQTGFIYDPRKQPTVRNFNMVRALLAWAPHCDEEALRAGLALVLGEDAVQPAFSTGALLAALSASESEALCDVGRGYGTEFVDAVGDDGVMRLRRVA